MQCMIVDTLHTQVVQADFTAHGSLMNEDVEPISPSQSSRPGPLVLAWHIVWVLLLNKVLSLGASHISVFILRVQADA